MVSLGSLERSFSVRLHPVGREFRAAGLAARGMDG